MPTSDPKAFFRACRACGGAVHTVASKCKHCGAELRATTAAPAHARDATPPSADAAAPAPQLGSAPAPAPAPAREPTPPPAPAWTAVRPTPGPTRGPAPAHRATAPPAISDASRRWLLVGGGALLLAIGMALGVLVERADRTPATADPAIASRTFTAQRPLAPELDAPDDLDFDLGPPATGRGFGLHLRPFSRRPRGGGSGGGPSAEEFARQLGDQLCARLADCADVDPAIATICRTVAGHVDGSELADQIARGECAYDAAAAGTCIDGLASLDCDADQQDPLMLMRTVEAVMACAEAVDCGTW